MAIRAFDANQFTGISLCAGYGGLELGVGLAEPGYRTVCFVEREAHAAATLVARMDDQALDRAPVWDDLRSFDGHPWRDRVHILSAGYPCQPFSVAGRRRASRDPRHLWPEVERIVDEVRPQVVFAENVEGHIDLGFAEVALSLQAMGYRTAAGLFTAREVGARHRRRRLFLMAHAYGSGRGVLPRADHRRWAMQIEQADGHSKRQLRSIFAGQRSASVDNALAGHAGIGCSEGVKAPLFAPGPGELQAWADLIDRRPDLQPAILRDDYGLADRLDRTRGVGNGVCSLAAAHAWRTLKAALSSS